MILRRIVAAVGGQPAVILENDRRLGIAQHIGAHHQPGIVFKVKEIADGRQDIQAGNRLIDDDEALHIGAPDEEAALVERELIQLLARQRIERFAIQPVGVVVGRQHDDGILIVAGLLQLLQQHPYGLIQLDITGKVGAGGLRQVQMLHCPAVAHTHGVAEEIILQVAADGEVVGHKMLIGQNGIQRGVHHIHIGFRPHHLDIEAVAHALIVIAEVGMGLIAGIIGVGVVVVGTGGVAHRPELVAEREGQPVGRRFGQAPGAGDGDEPQKVHIFAVQRADAPNGIVELGELEALAPQLVEVGGEVGVDGVFPQAFAGEEDEVFPLEIAGVVVFGAGRHPGKIAVDAGKLGVLGLPGQRRKVNIHDLRLGLRLRLRLGLGLRLGSAAHGRHGAEDGVSRLDAEGGKQPEAAHRKIADKIGGVKTAGTHRTAGIRQDAGGGEHLQQQRRNKRSQQLLPPGVAPFDALLPLPDEQCQRHQHQQQRPPAPQDGAEDDAGELGHLPCSAHRKQGKIDLEDGVVHHLSHVKDAENGPQDGHDDAPGLGGKGLAQKGKQQPRRQRKAEGVKQSLGVIEADGGDPQHQLHPQHRRREEPHPPPCRPRQLQAEFRFRFRLGLDALLGNGHHITSVR